MVKRLGVYGEIDDHSVIEDLKRKQMGQYFDLILCIQLLLSLLQGILLFLCIY